MPVDLNARWLASNAMPLAVFLNGLLLTLLVSAALNVFINKIEAGERQRQFDDVRQLMTDNLHDNEQSLAMLSVFVGMSSAAADESTRKIMVVFPRLTKFERLGLLQLENGHWQLHQIYTAPGNEPADQGIWPAPGREDKFMGLANAASFNAQGAANIVDSGGSVEQGVQEINRPFLLLQRVQPSNPNSVVLVAQDRVTGGLPLNWRENRPGIGSLMIRNETTNEIVFASGEKQANPVKARSTFVLGGANWEIVTALNNDARSRFLAQIPWLVFFTGLALTLTGTSFIRNRQRQAIMLTNINRMLGQRNRELNTEMAERHRLDAELDKAEREYKAIIDSVSDVIFELSPDGKILFLNHTWEKITGFTVAQTAGRVLFDLMHPQDQEEQRRNLEQMVKGRRDYFNMMTRIRTNGGSFRAVEIGFSMLRQDGNNMPRVVGTLTDVEERRRAERALGEAEKKFRAIVENAAGGIYQVTPEGQFLSVNPAMARLLGYDHADEMLRLVMNAHADLFINSAERARFLRELETAGFVRNYESEIRAKDGRILWVNENTRVVRDEDGSILYFEGSIEDITRRHEIEKKLREAKIQSDLASRAKSEFLANMSHELRTPLNAIIGFSEIIKNEVLGPLQNKQYKDYISDIYASGRRLLQIINEILDVSRIEAGERQLNEGVVILSDVVNSCVEFLGQKAEEAQLTVTNRVDFQTPRIIGEELAVKQIIINLLSNAIKFTPAGGHVTLSYEVDHDGPLRLSVTDTGNGLSPEEVAKALSPFGQVDASLSRSGSGAGLGLTLVDSLIHLHGGTLELFSQKGIGTTATVVFPHQRVAQSGPEEQWASWARK